MSAAHPAPSSPTTTGKPDLVIDFAKFASSIDATRLAPEVVAAVKRNIQDTLACALAGSSAKGIPEVTGLVREWAGTPQADMFVFGGRYPAHHVAWANSAMSHARDYDDTHDAAILHAGITAVPAAIAAAQLNDKATGADVIAGVAAGLEVTCRLGVAIKVDIIEAGFIYSSLLGYFGATAAAGRVMGLNEEQMLNAFGIVYSSVAGNHQVTRDASLMKRLQPGLGAQAAIVAVQLAQRGIRGSQHVFDGHDGFFRSYLKGQADPEVARKDLGTFFELTNLSYKPYPCCRDTHAGIDAALILREQTGRPASDIETVRVGVTAPGYQMVCWPEHVRAAPRTIVEAQFSVPYTFAAAWIDGRIGIGTLSDEALQRRDVLDLTARVKPYVHEEIERDWSRFVTPSDVVVEFKDGTTAHVRVDYPKGHPRNMMTAAEFATKAADCATFAVKPLPADTAERLFSVVEQLESLPDVKALIGVMTGA